MIDPENPRCCDCVGKGVGPSFLRIYQNILFFTPPSFFIVKSWHSLKSGLSKAHMQKFHLVDIQLLEYVIPPAAAAAPPKSPLCYGVSPCYGVTLCYGVSQCYVM